MRYEELVELLRSRDDLREAHDRYLNSDAWVIIKALLSQIGLPEPVVALPGKTNLIDEAAIKHMETVGFEKSLMLLTQCHRLDFLESAQKQLEEGWGNQSLTEQQ